MARRRRWSVTITAGCRKHPGFRPSMGEPGIRGGCLTCWRIVRLAREAMVLRDKAAAVNEPLDEEELRRAS